MSAYERVISTLASSRVYLTQKEIGAKANASQPVVSRVLAELRKQDNLNEKTSTYPIRFKIKHAVPIRTEADIAQEKIPHGITSAQMYAFLSTWAEEAWEPKVVKSLRNLPHAIAGLYALAVEAAYGADVTTRDTRKILELLNETRQDIVKVLEVVDRILATKEVWNPSDVALFLSAGHDIEKIQSLVHRTREIN